MYILKKSKLFLQSVIIVYLSYVIEHDNNLDLCMYIMR
jgi:hypothetical protein